MTRLGIALRTLALAGAILSCLVQAPASAAEHVTVMTDFPPVPMHAALYVAEAKGWFKDAGLDVEIEDGKGSNNTIQLVAAGQVDVGYVELGPLMSAREVGMKVVGIAAFTRRTDLGVVYDAKLGAVTPKDLAGKPVICFTGSFWTPFIKPFFAAAGVPPDGIQILNVDVTAMYASYMAKQADAILTSPPYGLPLVESVRPAKAIMASDYGIVLPGYGLVVREDAVQSRRATLAKVAKAAARGWQYLLDGHEDEGIQDIVKLREQVKMVPATAKAQLLGFERLVHTDSTKGKPMGYEAEKDWADAIATGERAGLIKPGHEPGEYYTNALIDSN